MVRLSPLCLALALATACGSPAPTASPTSAPTPTQIVVSFAPESPVSPPPGAYLPLPGPGTELEPGSYVTSQIRPTFAFSVGEGWATQQAAEGFFDIQQDPGSLDVIAVQFVNLTDGLASSESIAAKIAQEPNLDVTGPDRVEINANGADLGGLRLTVGTTDPLDTNPPIFRNVMNTPAGPLSIGSGRRLQIDIYTIHMGVFAVLVGGSVAEWDRTLEIASPVLDSIVISNCCL